MAAGANLNVEYFPTTAPTQDDRVGVCFSGGGSRALVAAMGQLRALSALKVLDKVAAISSVSGGSWAAAAFTYLPTSIADDDFLGPAVAPEQITPGSLSVLPSHNLGTVPQRFSIEKIWHAVKSCAEAGYNAWDLWQGVVGYCVLKPFGLWDVGPNRYPTKYYTGSLAEAQAIVARNPGLSVSDFYVAQRPRPELLINGSMHSNQTLAKSPLLPFQSVSARLGIPGFFKGQGVEGRDIGGGLVEAFAMGSTYESDLSANLARVTAPRRPFSLSDMVSISSAVIAEAKVSKIVHGFLQVLGPEYSYWPVENRQTTSSYTYQFADGGCLENTGLLALLSRGVRNLIVCVNTQVPLQQTAIDGQISQLFGQLGQHGEPGVSIIPGFCQVFSKTDLPALINGLWQANQVGRGPAMFLQSLTTVPNASFNVPSYPVRVLWVYNAWVDNWHARLRSAVQSRVDTQRAQVHFPDYDTLEQIDLTAEQVNLLAHLSCWCLQENSAMVLSLFDG